jgi:FO synthase
MQSSFVSGISQADAYRLIRALGGDLIALLRDASRVRDARMGRVITYSRKVFILLTNLCRDVCGYCTFAREPGDPLAHTMRPEEVLASARSARKAGRKEALFSLGDKPELHYPAHRDWLERRGLRPTVEYLQSKWRLVFEETGLLPHANPGLCLVKRCSNCSRSISAWG